MPYPWKTSDGLTDLLCFHRYGLPVNFQAMLLQPNKKNMKKLREVLYDLYKHLDSSAAIIDVSLLHTKFDRLKIPGGSPAI